MASKEQKVGAGLLALGSLMLLFAAFTKSWWTQSTALGSADFGLLGATQGGDSVSWSELNYLFLAPVEHHDAIVWLGRAAFGVALVTCAAGAATIVGIVLDSTRYQLARFAAVWAGIFATLFLMQRGDE